MKTGPAETRQGASAVILRGSQVLLVERGRAPAVGLWSFPGGHVEPGETAHQAALREVREETGLDVVILGLLARHEVRTPESEGEGERCYDIVVHYGVAADDANEPVAGGDARAARFVAIDEVQGYRLTEGATELIACAARLAGGPAG
jgi:ADP-ribose pyrophosphatase YjhB (NUDIX family)